MKTQSILLLMLIVFASCSSPTLKSPGRTIASQSQHGAFIEEAGWTQISLAKSYSWKERRDCKLNRQQCADQTWRSLVDSCENIRGEMVTLFQQTIESSYHHAIVHGICRVPN